MSGGDKSAALLGASAGAHVPLESYDDDYLYFNAPGLTPERNERDAELIVRLLQLKQGDSVLDIPCGYGRISNRLAARGIPVVGWDITESFLAKARAEVDPKGAPVDYVCRDMRELDYQERFDGALSWSTSFGYFDDQTNRDLLRRLGDALRPGGRLLIDIINREWLVRRIPDGDDYYCPGLLEIGDDFRILCCSFDVASGIAQVYRVTVRSGKVRRIRSRVMLPSLHELAIMLREAGFSSLEAYDEHGQPFRLNARSLVVVATRAGGATAASGQTG